MSFIELSIVRQYTCKDNNKIYINIQPCYVIILRVHALPPPPIDIHYANTQK